jgi:hypothetical protein
MTQPLTDAVRDAGLTPCLIVRVHCGNCGEMRLTATEAPEHCPQCSEPAYYYILGRGGTRRGRAVEPETNFRFVTKAEAFNL